MGLQTLYTAGAFGSGSDLWIIPELNSSSWSKLIDWYLNYQISRAKFHQAKTLSPELQSLLEKNEISPTLLKLNDNAPLMLASELRLPSKQVVVLAEQQDSNSWLKSVHGIWQELGKPTLRLFLPNDFDTASFQSAWPGDIKETDITLVSGQTYSNI